MKLKNKNWYWVGGLMVVAVIVILYFSGIFASQTKYVAFTDKRPVRGNAEASIVVVDWSDFECPACGSAYYVLEEVFEKYQDKVKFEYRHFPLPYHSHAFQAAVASECAWDQGKFWEYYHQLYPNQQNLSTKDLRLYAERIGLDLELFNDCLASEVKAKVVNQDLDEGKRIGISFTPSIFVNGQLIEDWTTLNQTIEALIEPVKASKKSESSS